MSDITVIVPYYNEEETISQTLSQLFAQTLQPAAVIMVNSSSTDASSAIVDTWISEHIASLRPKYLNLNSGTNTPGGSKAAGIAVAKTDLVAFMDCGLIFPEDWLQRQHTKIVDDKHAQWVSGGLITQGRGIVDQCAMAHTYGYNRFRPCMPSSLLRRSIFQTVGQFKDLRAGYDAQWIRDAHQAGLKRLINSDVNFSYMGTCFAPNLLKVFTKSILYARPTINSGNFITPCVYTAAATAIIPVAICAPKLLLFGALGYVGARLALAGAKSRKGSLYFIRPDRLLVLILTGAVMDFGKLTGYLWGFLDKLSTRNKN